MVRTVSQSGNDNPVLPPDEKEADARMHDLVERIKVFILSGRASPDNSEFRRLLEECHALREMQTARCQRRDSSKPKAARMSIIERFIDIASLDNHVRGGKPRI